MQRKSISSQSKPKQSQLVKKQKRNPFNLERILGCCTTSPCSLDLHPNQPLVCYPAGATAVIYNHKTNKQTSFLTVADHWLSEPTNIPRNHSSNFGGVKAISAVCFSPNGQYVAVGESGHQPRILVWELAGPKLIADLAGHKFGISVLKFSPNSNHLVSVGVLVFSS